MSEAVDKRGSLLGRVVLRLAPRNRIGDRVVALLRFLRTHRRWPSSAMRLPDYLFRLKTSDTLLDPLRMLVTDKAWVKLYVRAQVGGSYNVPTLALLDSPEAVRQAQLPERCCIKPTHLSGEVVFHTTETPVDRERLVDWLDHNHYDTMREINHRYLQPRVIVEPILFEDTNIADYKIFCYRGEPRLIQVDLDRHVRHTRALYTPEWEDLCASMLYPPADRSVPRPGNLQQMLDLAAALAAPFEFIRVDLYTDGQHCFVGELTNCPGSADEPFIPPEAEGPVSDRLFA
ncbi:hypothetical protein LRF89_10565 [Halorhodospira sp. 9621]|uniref:ATP-grasp fold amidoligase family protein n=1 Tax=Halorhodospira sp. 9621 TaxID=2899135 RepID=UPI001EE8FD81|nr:ATP-grasp fold amidoligase family protein [Halorhodospira sp. 9621]MCG5533878.1 hypothetical protein [Halorhodospira sp. 9621]